MKSSTSGNMFDALLVQVEVYDERQELAQAASDYFGKQPRVVR